MAEREYYSLHGAIQKFDDGLLLIKGWSVTVSMIGIGASYINKNKEIVVLCALSSLIFWYIEVIWKRFQIGILFRARLLEQFLHGKEVFISIPRIHSYSHDAKRNKISYPSFLKIALEKNICTPHIFIVVFAILYYFDFFKSYFFELLQ